MYVTIPDAKSGAAMRISVQCMITVPCDMLLQGEPKGPEQKENGGNGQRCLCVWSGRSVGGREQGKPKRYQQPLPLFPVLVFQRPSRGEPKVAVTQWITSVYTSLMPGSRTRVKRKSGVFVQEIRPSVQGCGNGTGGGPAHARLSIVLQLVLPGDIRGLSMPGGRGASVMRGARFR